jgi:hypothetical protein
MHDESNSELSHAAGFELRYNPLGRLVLIDGDGRRQEDIEPIRAFPVSDPEHGISICDRHGRELYWIDRLDDLPPEIRTVLAAELSQREFIPIVRRIVRMAAFSEPSRWVVETDRGQTEFLLGNEEDIHRIDDKRAMIVDTNGIRYLIADIGALDAHSRRILERYL